MSALNDTQVALDSAQASHAAAQATANAAAARVDALRAELTSGGKSKVTAVDLATAEQEATHASLVLEGVTAPLADLAAAVRAARTDQQLDQIVDTLPILGRSLLDALSAVEVALSEFTTSAQAYDNFAANATTAVNVGSLGSSRVVNDRFRGITVDRQPLVASKSERLLASALLPALLALRAPQYFVAEVQTIASAASPPVSA